MALVLRNELTPIHQTQRFSIPFVIKGMLTGGLNTVSRGSEMTVEVSIEIRELEEIKAHRASALALVPSALHKLKGCSAKSYLTMSPVPFALK